MKENKTGKRKSPYLWIGLALLCLFSVRPTSAQINRIAARTAEGLEITVSIDPSVFLGSDAEVKYRIRNRGPKTMYLVRKKRLEVYSNPKLNTMTINPDSVGFSDLGEIDYSFVPIKRGKILKGSFIIPANTLTTKGFWDIHVGLIFVDSIDELQRKSLATQMDPGLFRGLIAYRKSWCSLGEFNLLVKEKKFTGSKSDRAPTAGCRPRLYAVAVSDGLIGVKKILDFSIFHFIKSQHN